MKYICCIAILSFFAFSCKDYAPLVITSPAFGDSTFIPATYTCDGAGINPPINIAGIPPETKSLTVIVEDPDVLVTYDHWVVYNIPPGNIAENSKPGLEGENGAGDIGYKGSCPPKGTHHYHYKVYALNTILDLKEGVSKKTVEVAMRGHIIAYGELIGLYKKQSSK